MLSRMLRAARLDVNLYEEVEADKGANLQAMFVVIITSIAVGLGSLTEAGWIGVIISVIFGLLGWAVWAYTNYIIGTKLLKQPQTEADWGQLARTMGFATTPRLLSVFGVIPIPIFSPVIVAIAGVWWWIAMVIAVRQALDYTSTWRAFAVTMMGFILHVVVLSMVFIFI